MATRDMAVINDSKTNDVYELRDKKLADAQVSTTPSDITVNSVVPVELEDGSCIKIKRDSLVQAFASVLNSNSQSTITTLFGADSNGNHANINMANLASVLSDAMFVDFRRLPHTAGAAGDLDQDGIDVATYGIRYGWANASNTTQLDTLSAAKLGFCVDFNMQFQIIVGYNNSTKIVMRFRNVNSWQYVYSNS